MNKLFFFLLLLTCSVFSQSSSILYLHPNGARYKKVEMGIKSELSSSVRIISLVSKNEAEIKSAIENNSPKIVVVSGMDMIKIWKKLQLKYSELNQISSILLESEFTENDMGGFSNSCVVSSDTKLSQYIECVNQLIGKRPLNIGVIYSSKSAKIAQAYQKEAIKLNVTVYDKQVIASDPDASIKSSVKNLTDIYNVEFVLILDDPVTINNQNISTTWVSLLSGVSIPVAVPADYFYEIEPKIGSLAIQQHHSAIGGVIASLINGAEVNNWYVNQKYVYTDKSIFYFRNRDGSISKQNYVQNDIIASYHPKKEVVPVQPESSVEKQPSVLPKEIAIASDEKPLYDNRDLSFESEIPIQKTVQEKPSVTSEKPDQNKGKKEKTPAKKETRQTAPVEVASSSSSIGSSSTSTSTNDDIFDDVFSPANPVPEETIANTQSFLPDSDTSQIPPQKAQVDSFQSRLLSILLILVSLIVIAIIVYILLKKRSDKDKNRCLLITDSKKQIKYSELMNKTISLSRYFKKCGYNIIVSKYLDQINDLLHFNLPEVICIDWQYDTDIQMKFYKILKEQMFSVEFILIFYNVPDSAKTMIGYYEERTFYLNTDFTISDLNKILSIVQKRSRVQKQPDEQINPQLEGKIVGDILSEIFQMMDINKKTGCLIVETDHPAGMVFFEDGYITYAISNTEVATQAIFEILAMKSGRFHFIPEKKPLSRQMQASVVALLMEQAKCSDESSEFDLMR
jgi:hypothetical protein